MQPDPCSSVSNSWRCPEKTPSPPGWSSPRRRWDGCGRTHGAEPSRPGAPQQRGDANTHLHGPHQSVCWLRPKRALHFLGEAGSEHRSMRGGEWARQRHKEEEEQEEEKRQHHFSHFNTRLTDYNPIFFFLLERCWHHLSWKKVIVRQISVITAGSWRRRRFGKRPQLWQIWAITGKFTALKIS